ncbi:6-pyruvoyl trahydropterin synthase family protein [Roseomonas elaeocarpi]|uniref:6-carboxy-5,6,7,8-tetrahydropterin synthase n=1 Tax=Roseomonas elaeocarpi TaxID=907779 RepID=A0ABV6JT71_9PROT
MFSLTVADHIMVAHSFRGEGFGPAQRVHGATFVVEAEFRAPRLDSDNLLVDIAAARVELRRILDGIDYRNLDEVPEMRGQNTTTEYLCGFIHARLSDALRDGRLGAGGKVVQWLKVVLRESPLAWAGYEAPVNLGAPDDAAAVPAATEMLS